MVSSLVLATALFTAAAPAPKEALAPESPTGQAPRILELKPDADGKLRVAVTRPGNMQNGVVAIAIGGNGAPNVPQNIVIRGGATTEQVELGKVKDLTITTAGGKEVSQEDALKTLAKGGLVLISTDGKKVSPAYLKMFREEVLVLVSPEFVTPTGVGGFNIGGGGIGVAPAILPVAPPQPAPQEKK